MKSLYKLAALALASGVVGVQFVQPNRTNPPVRAALWNDRSLDPRVGQVLRRACADCHSNETKWPWYSKISPVSWFVARHVEKGRAKLNFSEVPAATQDQVEEIYESVAKNKMPLPGYGLIHRGARLSQSDRELLRAWADGKLVSASAW